MFNEKTILQSAENSEINFLFGYHIKLAQINWPEG